MRVKSLVGGETGLEWGKCVYINIYLENFFLI